MREHVLSASELRQHARSVLGRDVGELSTDEIEIALTFSTYVTDVCIAELERRGALGAADGAPVIPYRSHHTVDHLLTRQPFEE